MKKKTVNVWEGLAKEFPNGLVEEVKDTAKDQAEAQFKHLQELLSNHAEACKGNDEEKEDDTREAITENALSVLVRTDWISPSDKDEAEFGEYQILLCTGGPAVRIMGSLGEHCEPETARIEYQDWGTPWTEYSLDSEDNKTLLDYARHFYFGE